MPCDSSYLEATSREKELRRAAKLLAYVRRQQGHNVEPFVQGAANDYYCDDDRPLKLLCEVLTQMRSVTRDAIVYNARSATARDLANWWEEHQEADRERIAKEQKEKEEAKLRKQALAKLSSKERKALGL